MAVSTAIDAKAAENLWAATEFAATIGCPLNWFITIHWARADGGGDVGERFERVRICARHWLERNGSVPLVCLWVMEKGVSADPHTHWLIHIPSCLLEDFRRMLPGWIGGNQTDGLIDIQAIYSIRGIRKYILKGARTDAARRFGIRPVPQGQVTGKRCGTSQSIGPAARARWANSQTEQAA